MNKVCDVIKEEKVKDKLNKLINISLVDDKEHLLKFCSDNNKIILSPSCKGGKYSVSHEKTCRISCPVGTKEVGEFHTHPSNSIYLSKNDIIRGIELDFESTCIGYENSDTKERIVKCFDYPFTIDVNKTNKLRNINNESKEFHKKYSDKYYKIVDVNTKKYKESVTTEEINELKSMAKKSDFIKSNILRTRSEIKVLVKEKQKENCIEIVGKEKVVRYKFKK